MKHLQQELLAIGLEFNMAKTKIMTTTRPDSFETDFYGESVQIVCQEDAHTYLGRKFSGNLVERGDVAVNHRIQLAWMKYSHHRKTLQNKNVSDKLRLKLFDAVVSPTLLYGLATVPVGEAHLRKVDVLQRKMVRNIAGWVRKPDEPWEDTMRRMKQRVENASVLYSIRPWSETLLTRKQILLTGVALKPESHWNRLAMMWQPEGRTRRVGRPNLRWDSALPANCRAQM